MLVLGLSIGATAPIFAHAPGAGGDTPDSDKVCEAMHEACENGDWEAMAEAAEEAHGGDFDDMPCHGEGYYAPNGRSSMGDHMGGGMMGW